MMWGNIWEKTEMNEKMKIKGQSRELWIRSRGTLLESLDSLMTGKINLIIRIYKAKIVKPGISIEHYPM